MVNPKIKIQKKRLLQGMDISLSAILLKKGSNNCTRQIQNTNAKSDTSTDSDKNCPINWRRNDPTVFLIPTSFARFSLLAVLRFIKFMEASNKTNAPIIQNNQTNCI